MAFWKCSVLMLDAVQKSFVREKTQQPQNLLQFSNDSTDRKKTHSS